MYVELTRSNGRWYFSDTEERYTGTRYTRSNDGEKGLKAEKVIYDFASALNEYNQITENTVYMSLITFSGPTSLRATTSEDDATVIEGWTGTITDITKHLSSNGTTRPGSTLRLNYGGGTDWEAAMRRAETSVKEDLPAARRGYDTFVIFVTDGAPTFRLTRTLTRYSGSGTCSNANNGSGCTYYGYGQSTFDDVINYRNAMDEARNIQTVNDNTNFYGIYAYGSEGDLLDDLIYYAYSDPASDRTSGQNQAEWSGRNTDGTNDAYFNATDTSALQESISVIFGKIVETLGVGDVVINDGTTSNVTTSSGDISHLLNVDGSSFTYGMKFPVTAVSGETDTYTMTRKNDLGQDYTITLTKNEDGTFQATWGTNSVTLKGKINLGKFEYDWEEANDFYNVAPPAAEYSTTTGKVEWNLDRETVGTLLDDVTYTVYFDVYPSQETYDMVADIKNAENPAEAYNALDANIKKYLKRDSSTGEFTLETNTNATLTYTDNRNGNTTPVTKKYRNPGGVPTESSKMSVKKVWLNELDDKTAPEGLSIKFDVQQEKLDTHELESNGLIVETNKGNGWEESVDIATGLMRIKTNESGKQYVEVLDPGYDYALKEQEITFPGFKQYQWELEMETVHPMIVDGHLRTLVEVPTNEIPTGMTGDHSDVYSNGDHTFYRFNGHVYYDKYIVEEEAAEQQAAQDESTLIPEAHLNAYNLRKSNFNFTKKVEGDVVGDEVFGFTFTINDTNIDENNIPADATDEDKMNNYSVWFSVCDPAKLEAAGHRCDEPDSDTFHISDYLEKGEGLTDAEPEYKNGQATGYYYKLDNTPITVNIKDGWNVRVTNIGTESSYDITETTLPSNFILKDIEGTVRVSVPELPANAVQTSDTTYDVNGVEYTKVTDTIDGQTVVHYEFDYEPTKNEPNKNISGTIYAPNNTYAVTFTNEYQKTHLTVNKDWHVAEDAKKAVEVTLYRKVENGTEQQVTQDGLTNPVTLNAANNWTYTWKDLDVKDANNKVYEYYTKESTIEGGTYTTTYAGTEDIVVNATDIPLNTESIDVNVLIGDTTQTVTLNADNNWKNTLTGVSYINADGTPKFVSVRTESSATINYALTNRVNNITNEETTTVEGTKTWDDANNQDGVRPGSITINLIADGNKTNPVGTKVVTATNNWSWKWENLPKYKKVSTTNEETGETTITYVEIVYTVEEATVQYYEGKPTANTDYSITNTHTPFKSTVTINKSWSDAYNQDGKRPTQINVVLQDSTGLILTDDKNNNVITLTAEDGWTKTIEVQRKSAGSDVTYTVKEVGVVTTDYTATISNPQYETEETTNQNRVITLNLKNTHTPETVPLSGEKTWSDAGNQDASRPTSIEVTLYADGQPVEGKTITVTPNAEGKWVYNFGSLPKYKEGDVGKEIQYTVRENNLTSLGYTPTYYDETNLNILNSRTPDTTSISGTKRWVDSDNLDGIRPTSITVQLLRDGQPVEGQTQVLSAENNWTYSFANLQKNENRGTENAPDKHEFVYTVTDSVDDYVASMDGTTLVNTHTPFTTKLEGEKEWSDADNQDGIRPASITVQLVGEVLDEEGKVLQTIDTSSIPTQTLSDEAGWTYSFTGLQKNVNLGTVANPDVREITYRVTDTVDGYEPSMAEDGTTLVNTHTPSTIDIDVTKIWDDNDNQDGKRPDDITINLIGKIKVKDANGNLTEEEREIADLARSHTLTAVANVDKTDKNKWTYTFEDVYEFWEGQQVSYTISENTVSNYTPSYDQPNRTVTNIHTPGKVNVSGSKTWDDANNQDGKRPTSIFITLTGTKEGETTAFSTETIEVTEEDGWAWSWTDLPEYDSGKKINYAISEEQVSEYDEPKVSGYNVTNKHTPETTKVEGTKKWTDENNQDNLRPGSIKITLHAIITYMDGEREVTEPALNDGEFKVVTEADGWKWSWDPLPKYYKGHEIAYTITEDAVTYYDAEVTGYDVENIHTPFKTSLKVKKDWQDGSNQDGLRATEVKFVILKDGVAIEKEIVLNASNNWEHTEDNLPRYNMGTEIVYSVQEITQNQNYKADYTQTTPDHATNEVTEYAYDQVATLTVTNVHTPATVDVEGSKEWDDDGNRDGARPQSITIHLLADGVEKDSKTVTAAENWSWSWTDLPKFKDEGTKINYTITEDKVPEYNDPEVTGYDVKNTHTTAKTRVAGIKVWSDDENRDLLRPTSVTITLYADGVATETATASVESNWEYSFENLPKYVNQGTEEEPDKHEIVYTVGEAKEDIPTGYTPSVDGTTITNTHKPETTSISGVKKWYDDGDRDGERPTSITINVYDEDDMEHIVKPYTLEGLNTEEEWSYTIDGLPVYKNVGGVRKTITYVVKEVVPAGYKGVVKSNSLIENTYETEKISLPVSKTWVDEKGEKYRPTSITVKLLADGADTGKTVELNKDNGWASSFDDLPVKKDHGTGTVIYTVEEVPNQQITDYYDVSYPPTGDNEGKIIVNTIKDLSKDIPVVKVWDDENNRDNVRPTSITFTLKGTVPSETDPVYTDSITIFVDDADENDSNKWTSEFTEVPIFFKGTWITYSVEESGVDTTMYPTTTNETAEDGTITLTNSHSHLLKDIEASKSWADDNDNDGKRPGSVKITLFADGVEQETLEATAESEWKVTFKDYPVYREHKVGEEIEYTVQELDENIPDGYEPTVDGYTITNTHENATITYKVTKNWEDFDNNDGKRPDHITVHLVGKVGEEVVITRDMDVYEDEYGNWTYTFDNLQKYYQKSLIQYTLTEDGVDLYETQTITQLKNEEDTEALENTITNTHDKIPYNEDGTITVNKYWYDENDKYKKRPGSITVNLLADDEIVATGELNEENGWSYTFENLPKYTIRDGEVGCEIVYSIEEVAVEFYETEIDGFDIYNTYNGPVPEITPPPTGVITKKPGRNNNVLFKMIISLLTASYTIVVRRKNEQ
ncbi:MAG: Cna B-type domain-containing protein [Bacilli bacterium]|nr:Cna B-type domain-containing protein [Bacilli bacterium]